jgi:preprotein translocase subunit SecB
MTAPLSPLQLKSHWFTSVAITSTEGGSLDSEPVLEPQIWFAPVENMENHWRLALRVKLGSADASKPFAYEAQVEVQAMVQLTGDYDASKRERIAVINGLSILYSATREMIQNVTARSVAGPLSIPTLNLIELYLLKKIDSAEPTATEKAS